MEGEEEVVSPTNHTKAEDTHLHPSCLGSQDMFQLRDSYGGETVSGR